MAVPGLTTIKSSYPPEATMSRLEAAVKAKGLEVFARIDHAAAARTVGMQMPPTLVVLFGNPRAGTPLMLEAPDLAIDLPLRLLVREVDGRVELVFADPGATVERRGLPTTSAAPLAGAIEGVVAAVAG